MKVLVLESFTDRLTGQGYNYGSFYESNNKKRVEELREKGFLEPASVTPEQSPGATQNENAGGQAVEAAKTETIKEETAAAVPEQNATGPSLEGDAGATEQTGNPAAEAAAQADPVRESE